jgi:hypothetical protein
MKTLRHNTYETNSSSTHSITIVNRKNYNESVVGTAPIITDNVLLPKNLRKSEAYTEIETGDGGYVLKCASTYQKAALTVHYLNSLYEYVKYDSDVMTDEDYDAFRNYALKHLCERLGLDRIESPQNCNDYYHLSEYGSCPLIEVVDSKYPTEEFNKYVSDIILNEEIIIIDQDIPY